MIPVWKGPRRIGFLFPHPCERGTAVGCPDCNEGQIGDPYGERTDRSQYSDDYNNYSESDYSSPSSASFTGPAFEGGDSGGGGATADFTEADGESLTST